MGFHAFTKKWVYAIYYFILFTLLSFWINDLNQPKSMATPNLGANIQLQCISYAPYYGKGQSPLIINTHISHTQIDADLKLLSNLSHCVRTYSVGQGMSYVPEAAAKLGMQVYLGAWIGWVHADNEAEVRMAAKQANAFPHTVKAIVVGNEVLLRREQTELSLQGYLNLARSLTKTPLTYADVWEFWNKHKSMQAYVDFITVHILPYWEDHPIAIEQAVEHTDNVMTQLGKSFNKPILIGETGWPSVGRQRFESRPSLVNQARYVREFLQKAHEKNWQYNVIEAVDQPWKRNLEGTVGGYWGLYSTDLTPKFSLTGAVSEQRNGQLAFIAASLGMLLLVTLSVKCKAQASTILSLASLGGLLGLTSVFQWQYLITACRDWQEWLTLGGVVAFGWLALSSQAWYLVKPNHTSMHLLKWILFLLLLSAGIASYLIYIDGRYRDFPNVLFGLPAFVLSVNLFLQPVDNKSARPLTLISSVIAIVLAIFCYQFEPNNQSAQLWLAINLLIILANWPFRLILSTRHFNSKI